MKKLILLLIIISSTISFSQASGDFSGASRYNSKTWNKETSLFRAKAFLFQDIFGKSNGISKFMVEPLAASKSGEMTTLIYKNEELNIEGLILGFFGSYVTESGTIFTGYGFKNLNKEKATLFLDKIQKAMNDNEKYLLSDYYNNIYFQFEDMEVLIWYEGNRIFWKGFDSTWENTAFKRSKKRFDKKID